MEHSVHIITQMEAKSHGFCATNFPCLKNRIINLSDREKSPQIFFQKYDFWNKYWIEEESLSIFLILYFLQFVSNLLN